MKIWILILLSLILVGVTIGATSNLVKKDITLDTTTKSELTKKNITEIVTSEILPDICNKSCSNNPNWGRIIMNINGFVETRHFNMGKPFNTVSTIDKEKKAETEVKAFLGRLSINNSDTANYAKAYNIK